MSYGSSKICCIDDPNELRAELLKAKGSEFSCARCCARSDDPSKLCEPVTSPGGNLFCE